MSKRREQYCRPVLASLLAALLAIAISGCTSLGPDYAQPEVAVEKNWLEVDDAYTADKPPVEPEWWKQAFQDPMIDQLVQTALKQNLTLRSAGLRVLQSQQQLAIAIGNQFPQQQQITGDISRSRSDRTVFNNYSLGFNLAWEIDFWGRFSRQIESATAQLDASVAEYDGALVSLVSLVAQNYILIRTFQERLVQTRVNIKFQAESLRVSQAKFKAGEVSELDKDQAESLVYNTRATATSLEISLQQTKNSLAVLLGGTPQEFNHLLTDKGKIPTTQADIALGMPQDLIRRRPDIRVAERQLAAQSALIGVAETELYPAFTIGGAVGTQAQKSHNILDKDYKTWNLFGGFEWNIFNYGRLKSNVRLQDALFQQLLVDYHNTVLQAQGDVENNIVAYLKSHDQLIAYALSAAASQRSVNVALAQYRHGQVDFNTVINTLSANQQQQDILISTQGTVATNLVQVYKSLGGGWEIRNNADPVDFLPAEMKEEMRQRTGAWEGVLK